MNANSRVIVGMGLVASAAMLPLGVVAMNEAWHLGSLDTSVTGGCGMNVLAAMVGIAVGAGFVCLGAIWGTVSLVSAVRARSDQVYMATGLGKLNLVVASLASMLFLATGWVIGTVVAFVGLYYAGVPANLLTLGLCGFLLIGPDSLISAAAGDNVPAPIDPAAEDAKIKALTARVAGANPSGEADLTQERPGLVAPVLESESHCADPPPGRRSRATVPSPTFPHSSTARACTS